MSVIKLSGPTHKNNFFYLFMAAVIYVACRAILFLHVPFQVYTEHWYDSQRYLFYSHHALFGFHPRVSDCYNVFGAHLFNLCNRPFSYPTFLALAGQHLFLVYSLQLLISMFAWFFLGLSFAGTFNRPWQFWLSLIIVLLLSCQTSVIIWDSKILSESLSVSFSVLILGVIIQCLRTRFALKWVLFICALSIFYMGLRDSQAYLMIMVLMVTLIYAWRINKKSTWLNTLLFGIVIILSFILSQITIATGHRAGVAFSDLWGIRLQYQPEVKNFLRAHQAPISLFKTPERAAHISNSWIGQHIETNNIFTDINSARYYTAHADLRAFMDKQAPKLYSYFLLTHPFYTFRPFTDLSFYTALLGVPIMVVEYQFLGTNSQAKILYPNFTPSEFLKAFLHFPSFIAMITGLSLLILGFLWRFKRHLHDPLIRLILIGIVISIFYALLIYLAEPMEIFRHELIAYLLLNILSVMAGLKSLPYLIGKPTT